MDPPAPPRLLRRRIPPHTTPDGGSLALFRLAEACDYRCPMCSNSGRPEAWFHAREELLRRAERLDDLGFRRVILTGGEPTLHPAFWDVVREIRHRGMRWDINTHGARFADPDFTAQAIRLGLERAIVSLHHHDPEIGAAIFGRRPADHARTVGGIAALVASPVQVTVNCVVSTLNAPDLEAFVAWCIDRFGGGFGIKLAFPHTGGKGGSWAPIHLRYSDVAASVRALYARAAALPVDLHFESFPFCVLGAPDATNMSRSGFGETHYLEDLEGEDIFPIRHIEAELSVYAEACQPCPARRACPGVPESYAREHGVDELVPFPASP